jgi:hypothetical protein
MNITIGTECFLNSLKIVLISLAKPLKTPKFSELNHLIN